MRTSTELLPGLPIVPPYLEGELFQSHLRRIADANWISAVQLGRILTGHVKKISKQDSFDHAYRIAEKLGYPEGIARPSILMGFLKSNKNESSKRQFCPECLAQKVTQRAHLEEPAYGICLEHGLAHLVKCPACHKDLYWTEGRHQTCACGFDLTQSERITVSAETLELFHACLENRPLGDSQTSLSVDSTETRAAYLISSMEYLSTIGFKEESPDKATLSRLISNEAHKWECIGRKVQADPKRLLDVATEIEMRLVYTNTNPGTGVSTPENIRKAISWGHLREVAQTAHQNVIRLEKKNDICRIADSFNLDPQRVLTIQLLVNKCISIDMRAEMRSQFNAMKRQCGVNPEQEGRRVAALINLTEALRSVHELSWLKHMQAHDKVNLFAFIAAGTLQPWAAATFKNWHVLLSDVERLSRRLKGQLFPHGQSGVKGYSYVVEFSQIFSERAAPSDWLGLSRQDVRDQVERLVRMSEYPINSPDRMQDKMAIPVGFSAFLPDGPMQVCGSEQGSGGLEALVLVSQSWEAAAQQLTQACLRAQANFARLADWQRTSADIAWKFLSDIRTGTPTSEAIKKVNAELTEDRVFCTKSMRAAIERYEVT